MLFIKKKKKWRFIRYCSPVILWCLNANEVFPGIEVDLSSGLAKYLGVVFFPFPFLWVLTSYMTFHPRAILHYVSSCVILCHTVILQVREAAGGR